MKLSRIKYSLAALMLFCITLSFSAFARDTTSTITGVKITVGDSLKDLKAGDPWPDISENDFSVGDTEKYSIEGVQWYDNNYRDEMAVGEEARVIIYLNAETKEKSNGDEVVYRFSSSYGSSNVRVINGNFVSAKRSGYYNLEVILSLRAVGGEYEAAENLSWAANSLGYAGWTAPANTSGYYEVKLYREGRRVVSITTTTLSLNLYPWMTEEGEYSFSVTTIPYTEEQKKRGKKSEEVDSPSQTIEASQRSSGEGKYSTTQIGMVQGNSGSRYTTPGAAPQNSTVGWFQENGAWYFRYPNQQLLKSDWLHWKDRWYHFNGNGQMETGWFKSAAGNWFYLEPTNGYAKTGWQYINHVWYYFLPEKGEQEAVMLHNRLWKIGNEQYYFDSNGAMRTGWTMIREGNAEQYYYFYEDGRMARNTEISGFRLDANGRWVH